MVIGLPNSFGRLPPAQQAVLFVAMGLLANTAFNMAMSWAGYKYPFNNFLFTPLDKWGDFFKLIFTYVGDPIQQPVYEWAWQDHLRILEIHAREFRGTQLNPDHVPPLPTLISVLLRKTISIFDPVIVFFAIISAAIGLFAHVLFYTGGGGRTGFQWAVAGVISYPALYAFDRGHLFSLLSATALIAGCWRLIQTRRLDWQSALLIAVACNFRPNIMIVPLLLILGGKVGQLRDVIWIGLAGFVVLTVSMAGADALYPHYGWVTWQRGMADYNAMYVQGQVSHGFMTSLPSMLGMLFGSTAMFVRICLIFGGLMALATVWLGRKGQLTSAQIIFIGLVIMTVSMPSFYDYHLLPFMLPIMAVKYQDIVETVSGKLVFWASLLILIPKNYIYWRVSTWDSSSIQVFINPLALVAAAVALLAFARHAALSDRVTYNAAA